MARISNTVWTVVLDDDGQPVLGPPAESPEQD